MMAGDRGLELTRMYPAIKDILRARTVNFVDSHRVARSFLSTCS